MLRNIYQKNCMLCCILQVFLAQHSSSSGCIRVKTNTSRLRNEPYSRFSILNLVSMIVTRLQPLRNGRGYHAMAQYDIHWYIMQLIINKAMQGRTFSCKIV